MYVILAGLHCEARFNACTGSVCLNGGTCISHGNTHDCLCQLNYRGDRCESHICQVQSPCLNGGTCVYDGSCICPDGYTGDVCQVDLCDDVQCQHGGHCVEGQCQCQPGFTGIYQLSYSF